MVTLFLRCDNKAQFETIQNFMIEFVKCCSQKNAFLEVQNFTSKYNDKTFYHTFILTNASCLFSDKLEALKKCIDKMDYKIQMNYFKD